MYCPSCGKESKSGANFCRYCGERLPAIPPQADAEKAPPQAAPPKKTRLCQTAYILPGAVALCVLTVLAIFFASMSKKPESGLSSPEEPAQTQAAAGLKPDTSNDGKSMSEQAGVITPPLENETENAPQKQLISDSEGFFDQAMTARILGFNRLLQDQYHADFAWKTVGQLENQTLEAVAQEAFDAAGLGERDMLCAFVPSAEDWYVQCGAEIAVDEALRDLMHSGMDYIFSDRTADAVQRLYQTLLAWYGAETTSAEQAPSREDLLPDGFYIMDIYQSKLTPADEGVYAEGDIYQYVTLPKEALENALVGDSFDLSQFGAGMGYIKSIDAGGVLVASVDEPSEQNGYGGYVFHFREDQNRWVASYTYSGGSATYKTGYGKVLFPPETVILDYLSTQYSLSGELVQHTDIRDFFAYFSWPPEPEHEMVNLTVCGGVVTKAVINYHE